MTATSIASQRLFRTDELSATQRETLAHELVPIFFDSYGGVEPETVRDEILFRAGGLLWVFRDSDAHAVGFLTYKVVSVEVKGRAHALLEGGVYFVRGVKNAGNVALQCALTRILAFKLTHPLTPFSYVVECLTPISYRLNARLMRRIWPRHNEVMPDRYAALLSATLAMRGFSPNPDRPYVVRYGDPASHQRLGHLREITSSTDPDTQFYLQQNPHFADGDILCAIIPFDMADIVAAFMAILKARLGYPRRGRTPHGVQRS